MMHSEHEHEHVHSHTHDGIHYHSHEHSHMHTHEEGHTHNAEGHPHTHDGEHHHDHSHGIAPKDELIALIRYMVDHNSAHTDELERLAARAADVGSLSANKKITEAVDIYRYANAMLAKTLDMMK